MKILGKKAVSVVEYIILIIIIISAFVVLRTNIQQGIYGLWAQAGQGFAYGRQHDSQQTIECSFDAQSNQWYDRNCYQYYIVNDGCAGNAICEEDIITNGTCGVGSPSACAQICRPTSCSAACGKGVDNCGNPCSGTSC
jgi:hypothetical protein